jgi:hypothetical protein
MPLAVADQFCYGDGAALRIKERKLQRLSVAVVVFEVKDHGVSFVENERWVNPVIPAVDEVGNIELVRAVVARVASDLYSVDDRRGGGIYQRYSCQAPEEGPRVSSGQV